MSVNHGWKRNFSVIAVFIGVWLCLRYLFPLFLPFLLGLALALLAEPAGNFLNRRLSIPRGTACFAAVTLVLLALGGGAALAASLLVRRAAALAGALGSAAQQITAGIGTVRDWAVDLAAQAPASLAEPLTDSVRDLFGSGGELAGRSAEVALDLAGRAAGRLPGSLITLGTAILAAYLICSRLPALRRRLADSPGWRDRWRPALSRLGRNAGSWLRAQCKLSAVTFVIVLGGFLLLGVKQKLLMALLTALVDAVPLLGTGTVLLPWALVSFLSGEPVRSVGLLGVYVTALLTRSALEPRLVGRQLGLDPLASLAALYVGYRLWGFGGMIIAPILTVTARELCRGD